MSRPGGRGLGVVRFAGLLGALVASTALVHCVGDDAALAPGGGQDAAADQAADGSVTDGNGTSDGSNDAADASAETINPADPVMIATGFAHACVVLQRGDVFCWGKNQYGETGETPGGTATSLVPRAVAWKGSGAPAYKQVALASDHTCAADTTGGVYCWGRNDAAQLGNGDDDAGAPPTATPQNVLNSFDTFFKVNPVRGSLVARGDFACGVKANGGVSCWGTSEFVLDATIGGPKRASKVVDVVGIPAGPTSLASAGFVHRCVAPTASATAPVTCWGGNKLSQAGNGTTDDAVTVTSTLWPAGVAAPTQIESGLGHVCTLVGPSVYCWGYNGPGSAAQPTGGALDLVSTPSKATVFEAAGKTITRVAAGGMNTCALRSGEIFCVGANESGQLGTSSFDMTETAHATPLGPAQGIDDAVDVAVGGQPPYGGATGPLPTTGGFVCAIRRDKTTKRRSVWCWGANDRGQLGTGGAGTNNSVPVKVNGLPQ